MSSLRDIMTSARDDQRAGLLPEIRLQLHNVAARFTLGQDLGREPGYRSVCGLDDETGDRLIARTRQDAALAVYPANDASRQSQWAERWASVATVLVALLLWRIW
jgi:hypothetical protein